MQKEYKTWYDCVEKVIHWKLRKRFQSDYPNKWYMHNPESVQENKMQNILWGFEI